MINYIKIHVLWLIWMLFTFGASIKWFFKLERALDDCSPKYILWLKRYSRVIYRFHPLSAADYGNYMIVGEYSYINNIESLEADLNSQWGSAYVVSKIIVHQASLKNSPVVMKLIATQYAFTVKYYSKELQDLMEFYKI